MYLPLRLWHPLNYKFVESALAQGVEQLPTIAITGRLATQRELHIIVIIEK